MADLLVTVVVPAYNAAATIAETLESVAAMQVSEVETLVVDDASTDDTAAIVAAAAGRLPNLRMVRLPHNGGLSGARNAGIREARGAILGFLDADDLYARDFVPRCLTAFVAEAAAAAIIVGVEVFACDRPIHQRQLAAVQNTMACNLLVRREVCELIGGFPEGPAFRGKVGGEDAPFRQILRRHFREGHVPRPLLRHRFRRGGHLDYFLSRSRVDGERLLLLEQAPEERDGSLAAAIRRHDEAFQRRLLAAHRLTKPQNIGA